MPLVSKEGGARSQWLNCLWPTAVKKKCYHLSAEVRICWVAGTLTKAHFSDVFQVARTWIVIIIIFPSILQRYRKDQYPKRRVEGNWVLYDLIPCIIIMLMLSSVEQALCGLIYVFLLTGYWGYISLYQLLPQTFISSIVVRCLSLCVLAIYAS